MNDSIRNRIDDQDINMTKIYEVHYNICKILFENNFNTVETLILIAIIQDFENFKNIKQLIRDSG